MRKIGFALLWAGLLAFLTGFIAVSMGSEDRASKREEIPPDCNPRPYNVRRLPPALPQKAKPLRRPEHEAQKLTVLDTVDIVLPQGECFKEVYVCSIPAIPPIADILFDFDLTGSMVGELTNLRENSVKIMTAIREEVEDCNFALISGEDYPRVYLEGENCGYGYRYGDWEDLPYRLEQEFTSDTAAMRAAIDAMRMGYGRDCPESYTRRFHEATAELLGNPDPTYGPIGWREDAKKIMLSFNDAVPHDCDWTACSGIAPSGECVYTTTSGRDPGRDWLPNTADDLELMGTLMNMAALEISLVDVYSGPVSLRPHWDCWSGLTPGGGTFQINSDGTIPGGISIDSFIVDIIKSTFDTVDVVAPEVCAGDTAFLVSVTPPSYENVATPCVLTFEFEFCVPGDMPPGTYCFDICYMADGGEVSVQTFCIEVIEPTTFLDIKPGSCPNPLNVKSQGVFPVAILGRAGLDVTEIDRTTILLEGVPPIRSHVADVGSPLYKKEDPCECIQGGPDGFDDLTLKFRTQDIVEALGDVEDREKIELTLTAELLDGEMPDGSDCVVIIHNEWRKLNPPGGDVQGMDGVSYDPERFGIVSTVPNPFYGQVKVAYNLPKPADVSLCVYDLAGRAVRVLDQGSKGAGQQTAEWDGRDGAGRALPAGVYLCVLKSADGRDVAKIALLP